MDAAEIVISERGITGASISEIAAAAGVAVGTVYNHFADRDALVRALFRERRAPIAPMIRAAAEVHAGSFEAELRRFVRRVLEILEQHARFVRIAFEAAAARSRDPSSRATSVLVELRKAVEVVVARGFPRALDARFSAALAPILVGAIRAVVLEELAGAGQFLRHADVLVDIVLDGSRRR